MSSQPALLVMPQAGPEIHARSHHVGPPHASRRRGASIGQARTRSGTL